MPFRTLQQPEIIPFGQEGKYDPKWTQNNAPNIIPFGSVSNTILQHNAQKESVPEKILDVTGGKQIAQGLGQALANPEIQKETNNQMHDLIDQQSTLLKRKKEITELGGDLTHVNKALEYNKQSLDEIGARTGELLNQKNLTGEQVAGDALQLATTAAGGKVAGSIAGKVTGATGLLKGALQGAKTGAISGALLGVPEGAAMAMKDNESTNNVLENAGSGAILGGVSGGALGAISGSIAGKIRQVSDNKKNFVQNLVSPELSAKEQAQAIKTGKVVEETGVAGQRDYTQAIPNLNKIKESVDTVPGLSRKNSLLENSNIIHDEIGKQAEVLKTALQGKEAFSPEEFNSYMSTVKSQLGENPLLVGDSEKTAGKILNKFNSLVKEKGYTPSGLLEARKGLDKWMLIQKGAKVFDPAQENAVSVALRAIRQGGNKFIAEKVPDVAVQEMLAHQSNLYQAIENISEKAAKEGGNATVRFFKQNPKLRALLGTAAIGGIGAVVGTKLANAAAK